MKTATTHTPVPITENTVYKAIQSAKDKARRVMRGVIPATMIIGPPGVGKTRMGEEIASEFKVPYASEEAGTAVGLRTVLERYQNKPVLQLDDTGDHLWRDRECLAILKSAFNDHEPRIIPTYTVGGKGKSHSFDAFVYKAGTIFYTNTSPTAVKSKFSTDVQAVLSKCSPTFIPDDPLMLYEYANWVAVESGMLRNMVANNSLGQSRLSQDSANEILQYFAINAHRLTNVSPRAIELSAKVYLDLGGDRIKWRDEQDAALSPKPLWKLPARLFPYRVDWRHNVGMPAETVAPRSADPSVVVSLVDQIKARQQSLKAEGNNEGE